MDKIRVRNLRCLADTGDIDLKPLTFLLGVNSVGKSTFLRVFPLLRQSVETRTGSGLLLNEPYVDYGLFPVAVRKGAQPAEITLDFVMAVEAAGYRSRSDFLRIEADERWPIRCSVTFAARAQEQRFPFVRRIHFELGNNAQDNLSLEAKEDGRVERLVVNGDDLTDMAQSLRLRPQQGPVPRLLHATPQAESEEILFSSQEAIHSPFIKRLIAETGSMFHGNTYDATRADIMRAIPLGRPAPMLEGWRRAATDSGNQTLNAALKPWCETSPKFIQLRNIILADRLSALLGYVGGRVQEFARAIHYFMPVRAGVSRDYLSRDLQVESVDPSGANVAMVLNSLNSRQRTDFQAWSKQHFGFTITAAPTHDGSRVALRLKEERTGIEFNLADMGFGYSQMLPLIVQLWALSVQKPAHWRNRFLELRMNPTMSAGSLFAVEQPELHLHPALQSRVADLFAHIATVSRQQENPVRFMVETHSPTLIERVGQLIAAGKFNADDAQVLIFERGESATDALVAKVRTICFRPDGTLDDEFPFGFFLPPIDDILIPSPQLATAVA